MGKGRRIRRHQGRPLDADAVTLLLDLRDLAERSNPQEFASRFRALWGAISNRPALLKRLDQAGL